MRRWSEALAVGTALSLALVSSNARATCPSLPAFTPAAGTRLPTATIGQSYSTSLSVAGGIGPYKIWYYGGGMPPNLSAPTTTSGTSITISGTAAAGTEGDHNVIFNARDLGNTDPGCLNETQSGFTLPVASAPVDAGSDASMPDATVNDASANDASANDASASDSGPNDSGADASDAADASCGDVNESCGPGACCGALHCDTFAHRCCVSLDNACSSTSDCCAGYLCTAGKCQFPPDDAGDAGCVSLGASCASSACCDGLGCDSFTKHCCGQGGTACTTKADCCLGWACLPDGHGGSSCAIDDGTTSSDSGMQEDAGTSDAGACVPLNTYGCAFPAGSPQCCPDLEGHATSCVANGSDMSGEPRRTGTCCVPNGGLAAAPDQCCGPNPVREGLGYRCDGDKPAPPSSCDCSYIGVDDDAPASLSLFAFGAPLLVSIVRRARRRTKRPASRDG